MNAAQRRQMILERLTQTRLPVSAGVLAKELGVSRQIVVGDVALLRAGGAQIDATPRGYQLRGAARGIHRHPGLCPQYRGTDAPGVVHSGGQRRCGGGRIGGQCSVWGAARDPEPDQPLRCGGFYYPGRGETPPVSWSRMTGGVHLHTLRCPEPETFRRIEQALAEQGLLYHKE